MLCTSSRIEDTGAMVLQFTEKKIDYDVFVYIYMCIYVKLLLSIIETSSFPWSSNVHSTTKVGNFKFKVSSKFVTLIF